MSISNFILSKPVFTLLFILYMVCQVIYIISNDIPLKDEIVLLCFGVSDVLFAIAFAIVMLLG